MNINPYLQIGAVMSTAAALLHIAIIFKGAAWYRFFGAGEAFARAAESGRKWPDLLTLGIALLFLLAAGYAGAAAVEVQELPAMRPVLLAITSIYLLRGAVLMPLFAFASHEVTPLVLWSSLLSLAIGVVHGIGLMQVWARFDGQSATSIAGHALLLSIQALY